MNSNHYLMKPLPKIILASGSPRRKELLEMAGLQFEVFSLPVEETFPETLPSREVAEYLAIEKNKAYRLVLKDDIILTADTVVIIDDQILGKPKDAGEALQMLQLLSGKIHQVISGVCISSINKKHSFSSLTEVKFKELTTEEIKHYIEHYAPYDKAGGYAIQEWIGLIGIEWIKGSYYNVVGLPVDKVVEAINRFG